MSHILFAELTGLETTGLICALIFGGIGALVGVTSLFKKTETAIYPQPLSVEIVEEMTKQFAAKADFDRLVENNTDRHGQLFNRIDKVEREARHALDTRMADLAEDRRDAMEKLNNQFTFIRENIAAINRELQIRNES